MVDNAFLTELEVYDDTNATGADADDATFAKIVDLSSVLANTLARNGLLLLKDTTNGKYGVRVHLKDADRTLNQYLQGDESTPVYWVWGDEIFIRSEDTNGAQTCLNVALWYIKVPGDVSNNNNECTLNIALHGVVMDMAEEKLWRMNARPDKAAEARGSAMGVIEMLNSRQASWEAVRGIGTVNTEGGAS